MTNPVTTHVVGPPGTGAGMLTGLRRSAVEALSVYWWEVPDPVDPELRITRYSVLANINTYAAQVAEFDTQAEADQYVTDDPDGYLQ